MYDAIKPFADDLTARVAADESLAEAWAAAATLAKEKAAATADLMPKLGRARPLGKKSIGTPDAGATSMAALLAAVGPVITCKATTS
jgi:dihydroxyacetone kinase